MERQKQEVRIFERSIMSGSASAKSAKSLFDKLGSTKSIEAVVDEFYKRVLADTELKPFFAKTNMTWLRMRQVQFFTQALGGPALYKGKGMKEAHAKMTIGQHHFDLVAMHLVDTLKSLSVAQAEIDAVVSAVAPLAKDIVSK
jgi:hemoglobin